MARHGGHGGRVLAGRVHPSQAAKRGFWLFILSNGLWVAWGWQSHAPALVALQICLFVMNLRGLLKADASQGKDEARPSGDA